MAEKRREYGAGSIYQRKSDGRWVGAINRGWTREGKRHRIVVTAKTRAEVRRKLERKQADLEKFGDTGWNSRTTVKQWVDTYLERRTQPPKPLAPKAWKAAAQPLRRWVVPAIGHRRVSDLTPGDIRKVDQAQYEATSIRGGRLAMSTVAATRRALMTCLRHAQADGAGIAEPVFLVTKPDKVDSDRMPITLPDTLKCLAVASEIPHGIRWALTLLYGARQGEMLGLVERDPLDGSPCLDFDAKIIRLAWQLQQLDYVDRADKARGFKIPRGYDAIHLTKRFHLTRPKSHAGIRELPMIAPIESGLRAWLENRPANPWGLVFPTTSGLPCDDKHDREEWWAIQGAAEVGHPGGRYYHIHECRNTAATELDKANASDLVVTSLLGHTSIQTSRRYQLADLDAKRDAIESVAKRLGLS